MSARKPTTPKSRPQNTISPSVSKVSIAAGDLAIIQRIAGLGSKSQVDAEKHAVAAHNKGIHQSAKAALGEAIRAAREAQGISIQSLAIDMGTYEVQILQWEQGTVNMRETTYRRLVKAIGIDPIQKVTGLNPMKEQSAIALVARKARILKGWSQRELGEIVGINCSDIGRFELGYAMLTPVNMLLVMTTLGISRESLSQIRANWRASKKSLYRA